MQGNAHSVATMEAVAATLTNVADDQAADAFLKRHQLDDRVRPYQRSGFLWQLTCAANNHGGILSDEMGLGKTCQAIIALNYLLEQQSSHRALVVVPLTVLQNWREEFGMWAPQLRIASYHGDKEAREKLRHDLRYFNSTADAPNGAQVLLTTYEMCINDESFLKNLKIQYLVVDEGHRLKNSNSQLHKVLLEMDCGCRLLLTGTPLQNNLEELYALLSFAVPRVFPPVACGRFVRHFTRVTSSDELAAQLQTLIAPFLLRRLKSEVTRDIPPLSETFLYHGLSQLQLKLYKSVAQRHASLLVEQRQVNVGALKNLVMQLRKVVAHPYLFPGIEPEPFEMGPHLHEASAKLSLLDKLLTFLQPLGHRVLIFSQMTRMLDIVQDYLDHRRLSYERLDGSIRGQDRYDAVNRFERDDVFVFLLSTRAGGVGLNLVAADTVVILDSDWNPQNDLQAAARAHRIGQRRAVKVLRLLGRHSVEESIVRVAQQKLRLTQAVLCSGEAGGEMDADTLRTILRVGLDKLLGGEEEEEIDLTQLLGNSVAGVWQMDEDVRELEPLQVPTDDDIFNVLPPLPQIDNSVPEVDRLRSAAERSTVDIFEITADIGKKRPQLSEEEKERRRVAREEKVKERWAELGYVSAVIPTTQLPATVPSDLDEDDDVLSINFVRGDVTSPEPSANPLVILHTVDTSGEWATRGLFGALQHRYPVVKEQYEFAKSVGDLHLGSAHLIDVGPEVSVALLACQRRHSDRTQPLQLAALEKCLVAVASLKRPVHLPRIGDRDSRVNWYAVERLVKKLFTDRRIPATVYYFSRIPLAPTPPGSSHAGPSNEIISDTRASTSKEVFASGENAALKQKPRPLEGCSLYISGCTPELTLKLERYVWHFGGVVADSMDHQAGVSAPLVVVPDEASAPSPCSCRIVLLAWLMEVIKKQDHVPLESYIVMPSVATP